MKIIAKTDNGYICEVSEFELHKYFKKQPAGTNAELLYADVDNRRSIMGKEFNLNDSYDFLTEIRSAADKLQQHWKASQTVVKAVTKGVLMLSPDLNQENTDDND